MPRQRYDLARIETNIKIVEQYLKPDAKEYIKKAKDVVAQGRGIRALHGSVPRRAIVGIGALFTIEPDKLAKIVEMLKQHRGRKEIMTETGISIWQLRGLRRLLTIGTRTPETITLVRSLCTEILKKLEEGASIKEAVEEFGISVMYYRYVCLKGCDLRKTYREIITAILTGEEIPDNYCTRYIAAVHSDVLTEIKRFKEECMIRAVDVTPAVISAIRVYDNVAKFTWSKNRSKLLKKTYRTSGTIYYLKTPDCAEKVADYLLRYVDIEAVAKSGYRGVGGVVRILRAMGASDEVLAVLKREMMKSILSNKVLAKMFAAATSKYKRKQ